MLVAAPRIAIASAGTTFPLSSLPDRTVRRIMLIPLTHMIMPTKLFPLLSNACLRFSSICRLFVTVYTAKATMSAKNSAVRLVKSESCVEL